MHQSGSSGSADPRRAPIPTRLLLRSRRALPRWAAALVLAAALVVSLLAVLSTPPPALAAAGATCGCTGPFVAPATKTPAKVDPAIEDDGTSPGGAYRLTPQGPNGAGIVTLTVTDTATGKPVLSIDAKASASPHWGFSPDDESLAVYGNGFGEVWSLASRKRVWRQDGVDASYWFSPRGGFLVAQAVVSNIPRVVVVNAATGSERLLQGFTNLGFGKRDDRLAVWSPTDAQLWDLSAGKALWTDGSNLASSLGFSPDGGYLEVQQVTQTTHVSLRILRVGDGTTAWADSFIFTNPPPGGTTPIGDAGGGFSPDGGSFVEAYRSAVGTTWLLVDLEAGKQTASRTITQSSAFWRFSPCGHAIGLVQPSGITLLDTSTGKELGSYATGGAAYVALSATTTSYVATVDGTDHVLAANGAGQSCPTNTLASLTLPPGDLRAGDVTGTVVLAKPAAGPTPVPLTSSAREVGVPASVTVATGQTSATFSATVLAVSTARTVTVTAALGGVTKTCSLRLVPPALAAVTGPDTAVAHNEIHLIASLDGAAPSGGTRVTVETSDPDSLSAGAATISAGETSGELTLVGGPVTAPVDVTVDVTAGGRTRSVPVRVEPLGIAAVELPDEPVSSDVDALPMTVRLNGVAPPGGVAVRLASSRPDVLAVPEEVTVSEARSTVVDLAPRRVTASTAVEVTSRTGAATGTVTGTATGTATATDTVELLPPVRIAEVEADFDTAFAGLTRTLHVTLDRGWNGAVEGGTKSVAVSVSPSRVVGLPDGRSLTVENAGSAPRAALRLKFGLVTEPTDVVVTLTLAGASRTFTFHATPPPAGTLFTAAGGGRQVPTAEPRNPLEVTLSGRTVQTLTGNDVRGVAVGRDGAVYVRYASSQHGPYAIARIDADGVRRIAGDGQATDPDLPQPDEWGGQIDVGPDGTVYVAGGPRLTAVAPDGSVSTVPGSEELGMLEDVAVDHEGNLFAADWTSHRVIRFDAGSSEPVVVVNTDGVDGSSGDGGPAADAHIGRVYLDVAPNGALLLGDRDHHVLRRVAPDGTISTIAGTGQLPPAGTTSYPAYVPARTVPLDSPNPTALAGGAVAFSDRFAVHVIGPDGYLVPSAGNGTRGTEGDGYPAGYPGVGLLSRISQVATSGTQLIIGDAESARVRQVHFASGVAGAAPFTGQSQEHDFGTVRLGRASPPHRFTFTNDSDLPVPAGPTRLVDPDGPEGPGGTEIADFVTQDDTCSGRVLEPGASCSLSLAYRPGTVGEPEAELRIAGPGYAVGSVTGSTPNPVSVSPDAVELGTVVLGEPSELHTFVATNGSDEPVSLDNAWELPAGAEVVSDECAGLTLPPDGQCTVGVRVTPDRLGWGPQRMTLHGPGPVAGRSVPYVRLDLDLEVVCPSGTKPNGGTGTSGPKPTSCIPAGTPTQSPSTDPTQDPTSDPSESPSSTPSSTPSGTPTVGPSSIPTVSPTTRPTTPVRLKPQGVRARALARTVRRGKRVTILGTISPGQRGKQVVLQQYVGGRWVTLRFRARAHRDATAGRDGARASFVLRFKPRATGRLRYRVLSPATEVYAAATSRAVVVKVRRR